MEEKQPSYNTIEGFKNCQTWKDFVLAYNLFIAKEKNNVD